MWTLREEKILFPNAFAMSHSGWEILKFNIKKEYERECMMRMSWERECVYELKEWNKLNENNFEEGCEWTYFVNKDRMGEKIVAIIEPKNPSNFCTGSRSARLRTVRNGRVMVFSRVTKKKRILKAIKKVRDLCHFCHSEWEDIVKRTLVTSDEIVSK
jgi:hypothetical protein